MTLSMLIDSLSMASEKHIQINILIAIEVAYQRLSPTGKQQGLKFPNDFNACWLAALAPPKGGASGTDKPPPHLEAVGRRTRFRRTRMVFSAAPRSPRHRDKLSDVRKMQSTPRILSRYPMVISAQGARNG
jgi:hypothetical protein